MCRCMVKSTMCGHSTVTFRRFGSHVLVEPVNHVCSGFLDAGFVCRIDIFSLAVDEPVSLTREDLHPVIHFALVLQPLLKDLHLRNKRMKAQIVSGYMAENVAFSNVAAWIPFGAQVPPYIYQTNEVLAY